MLVAIDALTKKVAAEPLKNRLASTTAAGVKKVFQAYSNDGSEFKREFKELMDFWHIKKQVARGNTMLRRIAAGAGRRGQWRLMLADILSQINGRKHATTHTQVAPNLAYSNPEMAKITLRNVGRRAKRKVTRPKIRSGIWFGSGLSRSQAGASTGSTRWPGAKGIQGSLRQERKDGGKVWLGGVGKSGAQESSKSPQKLSFPN